MKKKTKKLGLTRETLTNLDSEALDNVAAAARTCQESVMICSVMHTCVSCVRTDTCA
jgi:hypothetical protein